MNMKRTPGGISIIDDAFNSNPDGARMALDVLRRMTQGSKYELTIEVASLMPARPFPCAKAEAVAAIISAAAMINFCLMFLFINCSFLCRPKGG